MVPAMAKQRIDSTTETACIVSGTSAVPIAPPSTVPLDAAALSFFASIVAELPKSEWSRHMLEVGAVLARMLSYLEREQRALRAEGAVLATDRGQPMANPRLKVVATYVFAILAIRRSLGLHARSRTHDPDKLARRRAGIMALEEDAAIADADDLLARPDDPTKLH